MRLPARDSELHDVRLSIKRWLTTIAMQQLRISQIRGESYYHQLVTEAAQRTLQNMQKTLTIARINERVILLQMRRELGFRLVQQAARRGALLSKIAPEHLPKLLDQHQISSIEATSCMRLHREWQDFTCAERWHVGFLRPAPTNALEAIEVLDFWNSAGRPCADEFDTTCAEGHS